MCFFRMIYNVCRPNSEYFKMAAGKAAEPNLIVLFGQCELI